MSNRYQNQNIISKWVYTYQISLLWSPIVSNSVTINVSNVSNGHRIFPHPLPDNFITPAKWRELSRTNSNTQQLKNNGRRRLEAVSPLIIQATFNCNLYNSRDGHLLRSPASLRSSSFRFVLEALLSSAPFTTGLLSLYGAVRLK